MTSSIDADDAVERTWTVLRDRAARAVANSPSGVKHPLAADWMDEYRGFQGNAQEFCRHIHV